MAMKVTVSGCRHFLVGRWSMYASLEGSSLRDPMERRAVVDWQHFFGKERKSSAASGLGIVYRGKSYYPSVIVPIV